MKNLRRVGLILATTAISLAVAAWLVDGIRFTGPRHGLAEIEHKIIPLLIVAAILGLVTSFVKPVLTVLSIPFIILTLGLFLLVINAAQQGETFITLILVTLAMDVRKPIIVLLKTICSIKGLLNIDHETDLQLPEFN